MRYLIKINRDLDEDNRLQSIILHYGKDGVFELYKGKGDDSNCYYITEHGKPDNIVMVITKELWGKIFEGK